MNKSLLVCASLALLPLSVLAADPAASTAPASPAASQAAVPAATPAASPAATPAPRKGRRLPNERELSPQDYARLGKLTWDRMQTQTDPQQRDLGRAELEALVDHMQRNRNEITLSLDDLVALIRSPALCGGGGGGLPQSPVPTDSVSAEAVPAAPTGTAFGIPLERALPGIFGKK